MDIILHGITLDSSYVIRYEVGRSCFEALKRIMYCKEFETENGLLFGASDDEMEGEFFDIVKALDTEVRRALEESKERTLLFQYFSLCLANPYLYKTRPGVRGVTGIMDEDLPMKLIKTLTPRVTEDELRQILDDSIQILCDIFDGEEWLLKQAVSDFNVYFKEFLPRRLFLSEFYSGYEFLQAESENDMNE